MEKITTIFSDLGNVVVQYDNMKAVRALTLLASSDDFKQKVHHFLFSNPYGIAWRYAAGDLSTEDFRYWAYRLLCLRSDYSTEAFDEAYSDIYTVNQEVFDLWRSFRRHGKRVYALSDVEEIRYQKLVDMGIIDQFDDGVYSYQEGALKRDGPKLFVRALHVSGCEPEEVLFVDDLEANCRQAEALGITTYLYDGDYPKFFAWLVRHLK